LKEHEIIEIGKLNQTIAEKIEKTSAKIVMNEQSIKHISEDHAKELEKVGLTAIDFVKFVVDNYNEIRLGKTNELFLVVKNGLTKVAVIRMHYEKGYYIVETASIMRNSFINKKELIWLKERTF